MAGGGWPEWAGADGDQPIVWAAPAPADDLGGFAPIGFAVSQDLGCSGLREEEEGFEPSPGITGLDDYDFSAVDQAQELTRSFGVADLKRLFLEMTPEDERRLRATEMLELLSQDTTAACIPMVLDRVVNYPTDYSLGIHMLREILRQHPGELAQQVTHERVYDLFCPGRDDAPAAMLLHGIMCFKEARGRSCHKEAERLQKLLIKRAKQDDLRHAPVSELRGWLCRIWLDVPSSRPPWSLLVDCCARWIGDQNAGLMDKLPCVHLVRQEAEKLGKPEGDAWLLTMLFQQVCRDPMQHSPDLQLLLWPTAGSGSHHNERVPLLTPLLDVLEQDRERLLTLWICLCMWVPRGNVDGLTPRLASNARAPIHALLIEMYTVISQMPDSDDLCCSCLALLAALCRGGRAQSTQQRGRQRQPSHTTIAESARELLLALHKEGPPQPSAIWEPVLQILEEMKRSSRGLHDGAERMLVERLQGGVLPGSDAVGFGTSDNGTGDPVWDETVAGQWP